MVHNFYIMKHDKQRAFNRSFGGMTFVLVGAYAACVYGKNAERRKVIETMERAGIKREVHERVGISTDKKP